MENIYIKTFGYEVGAGANWFNFSRVDGDPDGERNNS